LAQAFLAPDNRKMMAFDGKNSTNIYGKIPRKHWMTKK
jgi:hypothetical protein